MFKRSKRAAALALALAMGLAAGGTLPSAKAADIDVLLALPTNTLTFTAAFLAEDGGFYKKNGLNVTHRFLAGVSSNNAVINGSADFLLGSIATMLNGAAMGQPMLMIANMVDKPMVEIVIRKDIADAAGVKADSPLAERIKLLKGKTIAVQGIGSMTHSLPRLTARRGGFDPETDIRVTPMDPATMLTALSTKQVDGYSTSLPFTTEAVVKGAGIILISGPQGDMNEYQPLGYTTLGTRPDKCQKEREKCLRMVAAFADTAKFMKEKPAETYALIQKRFEKMDPTVLEEAWKVVSKAHTADVRIKENTLDNSQKWTLDAGLLDPKNQVKSYKGLWTDEFVK
jgi:NitT/TauT family transport system substrate-binding protein